jgi:hypothetical protein
LIEAAVQHTLSRSRQINHTLSCENPRLKSRSTIYSCCLLATTLASTAFADYQTSIRPLLAKYCLRCHGAEEQNARIRYDQVARFENADQHLWAMVHEALVDGEMPPQDEPQLTPAEKQMILDWIIEQARLSEAVSAGTQRRLNRREFSAALQDLTGLPIDFGAGLPDDARVDGFDTGAAALQDAADSVAQLLEVSRRAVESIRFLEPDRDRILRIDFREHDFTDFRKFVEQRWADEGVFTRSKSLTCRKGIGVYLPTQWTGDRGNSLLAVPAPADKRTALKLTLRVAARRPLPGLPTPTLWVKVGGKYIDYLPIGEEPQTLTYAIRMEDHLVEGDVIKIMLRTFVEVPYAVDGFENDDRSKPEDNIPGGIGVYRPKFDRKVLRTPDQQPVPSIVIESLEIDYGHRAAWPPASWDADVGTSPTTTRVHDVCSHCGSTARGAGRCPTPKKPDSSPFIGSCATRRSRLMMRCGPHSNPCSWVGHSAISLRRPIQTR